MNPVFYDVDSDDDVSVAPLGCSAQECAHLRSVDSFVMGATRESTESCDADAPALTHEALKARGNAAYRRKDYEEVRPMTTTGVRARRVTDRACVRRAQALEAYMSAHEMNGRDVALLTNMSATYHALLMLEDALQAAMEATYIDPTWAKGWYRAALVHQAREEYTAAARVLERGLNYVGENEQMRALFVKCKFKSEKDKYSAEEMKEKGNSALRGWCVAEAVEWYTRGIAKAGTSGEPKVLLALYNNRAECHRREYNHVNVIADCKEALKIDADNLKANLRLAVACEHLEKFTDAIEAYERVLKVDKKDTNRVRERITRCRVAERYIHGVAHAQ